MWMVLSGIYAVIVVAVAVSFWPGPSSVSHHPSFIYRMNDDALKILARKESSTMAELEEALVAADKKGSVDEARMYTLEIKDRRANPWKGDPFVLEMANGFKMQVSARTSNEEKLLLGKEYARVVNDELAKERWWVVLYAFLSWLVPLLVVCALGLLARWVYQGFKKGATK